MQGRKQDEMQDECVVVQMRVMPAVDVNFKLGG